MSSKPRFVGEKVKLGELISKAKVERCGDRSFPVYSMTMHDGIVEQSGRFKKTIASRDTSSYKVVKKNQLVVGFPIDEGVIYVQNHDQPGIMSPAYNVWDFDSDRILPAYLEFVLHSPQSMVYYAEKMRGTTARRRTLAGDALKNMPVPVPSIEDQYAVVKTLNCIKSQLAATQQMLDKLDQLVKSRFVEMFGDPAQNNFHWRMAPLGENAKLINGRAYKQNELLASGKYPVLRVGNFFSNRDWYYSDLELDEKKYCNKGDLLYAWSASFGPKIWDGGKVIYHYHIWKVEVGDAYNKHFLCKLLKYAERSFLGDTHGIGMLHLTKAGMEEAPFIVPPLDLQDRFAAFASQVDKSRFASWGCWHVNQVQNAEWVGFVLDETAV